MSTTCPCGSKNEYSDCCGAIINGKRNASTAEELMRSRYSAFVKADIDYLMRSHHSKTRPLKERKDIETWTKSVQWMGLVILNTAAGQINDLKGHVEFRALYLESGRMEQIHENSLFEKENGKWVYVSGEHQ